MARDFARQEAREAAVQESAAQWELEREKMQAHESQADNFHALQLARQAIRKWQASVQHAKALRQEQQEREERLHQAAKMERLREGVLLVRFYVLFIMGVKERDWGAGLIFDFLNGKIKGCESQVDTNYLSEQRIHHTHTRT